jgi:putative drug exporter of the RND superfamily
MKAGLPSRIYTRVLLFLRVFVIAGAIAAAYASWHYLPGISSLPESGIGGLLPSGSTAARAEDTAGRIFGSSLLPRIAVVQRNPRGLSIGDQRRIVRLAVRLDEGALKAFPRGSRAVPYINTLELVPGARERSTTAITYLGFPDSFSPRAQRNLALAYARVASLPGAPAAATGFVPGSMAQSDLIDRDLRWVEIATVLVISAIIGVYLRALLAPLVTLAAAAIAYLASIGVVSWLAQTQGFTLHVESEPIIVVLLLGVVTDYSVFFLSGVRDRLRAGDPPRSAHRGATALFLPIVFTAGLVVACGLATLRLASIGFIQQLGPAMAIVVLISLAVSITFVPATIATFGRLLFWPGLRASDRSARPARFGALRRGVAFCTSRRLLAVPIAAAAAAALVIAGGGLGGMRLALTPILGLDSGSPAAHAALEAGEGFTPGVIAPTELILTGRGVARRADVLEQFGRALRSQPEIGAVIGADVPLPRRYEPIFRARSGDAARYYVAFRHHPYGSGAISDLGRLEAAMPRLLRSAGLSDASVLYAGDTALAKETVDRIHRDLLVVAVAAALVNFGLLALFLRALLAPLLIIGSSVLAITATFGLTTLFFREILGVSDLTYFVPLAAGVLLLSLGSDYNLFVVGRIWQEAKERDVGEAIEAAVPKASRAVSIAGLALACSFATLAIVPIAPFRELAVSVGLGALVDTFVVRTLLVPSLLAACGRRSWWPGARSRRVEAIAS